MLRNERVEEATRSLMRGALVAYRDKTVRITVPRFLELKDVHSWQNLGITPTTVLSSERLLPKRGVLRR